MKNYKILYALIIIVGAMLFSCELDPDFDPNAPLEITAINNLAISAPSPLSCSLPTCDPVFTATSDLVFPANVGDQMTYTWDFGDGSAEETGNNITHTYTDEGEYNITLKANAPGATEASIDQAFIVSPKSSFFASTDNSFIGMGVREVSDGYIVFGLNKMSKFDKQGNFLFTRDPSTEIPNYYFGDFHVLPDDKTLVVSYNGSYADMNANLNFDNTGSVNSAIIYINAVFSLNSALEIFGYDNLGLVGSLPMFPAGPFLTMGDDTYHPDAYGQAGGELFPGIRPSKHFKDDNQFYIPASSKIDGQVLFGYIGNGIFWRTVLGETNIISITNEKILAYEDFQLVVYDFVNNTGDLGAKRVLCDRTDGFSGNARILSDGDDFIVAKTFFNEFNTCDAVLSSQGEGNVVLTKYDQDFNIIWEELSLLPNTNSVQIEALKKASDGGYIMTGTAKVAARDNLILVKANSEGKVE